MALDHPSDMSLAQQLAAVQEWWLDAGVDCAFVDEPQAMLREPEAAAPPRARVKVVVAEEVAAAPAELIPAQDLPADLAAFREWWCDPASPLPGPPAPRIAPIGEPGAKLMLIAPMPERDDTARLFDGPQGRMLRNMLGALGIGEDETYFATALPAAMSMPGWEGLAATGLGAITAHHITLARPERVLLLGNPLAPLVSGNDIPTLATFAPDQLLAHARQRARLWSRLLDWMPPR